MKTVGENIRTMRERRGLTVEQLAERAALSPDALQRIERGE